MRNACNRWRWSIRRSSITPGVAAHSRSPHQAAYFASSSNSGSGGSGDSKQDSSPPPPPPPPPPLAFLDVPYFEGDGACDDKHRLDVYIPSAPFPRPRSRTCLFVHGGSWQRGDRRHPSVPDQFYGNVGRAFAARGLVGLVMSYRLAPGVQHPEQVRDVARAIRWARDNVSQYGGDGDDLVLVGHSAGAHLAALCLADGRWLEEAGVLPARPTSLAGVGGGVGGGVPTADSGHDGGGDVTAAAAAATAPGRAAACAAAASEAAAAADAGESAAAAGAGAAARGPAPSPLSTPPAATATTTAARVVSGFVGISGVYDIPRMAGNVVGGVLARAAFGGDRRTWLRASPVHRVRAAARGGVAGGSGGGRGSDDGPSSGRNRGAEFTAGISGEPIDGRGDGVRSPGARTTATPGGGGEAGEVAARASAAETGAYSVDDDSSSAGSSNGRSSDGSSCPLLSIRVLLLTAASDFHLEDDAEALMDALGFKKTEPTDRTGGNGIGGGGAGRRDGIGSGGSARHVRLEGEDHLSCMVSFGEPGGKASDAVLEFVLGLPPPRRTP